MNTVMKFASVIALAASSIATAADAAMVFVGSWRVDQGPSWVTAPTAYSGQQAAALLFGGTAGSYSISTVDNTVANIDNLAWVTVWNAGAFPDCAGFPCGRKVAENAVTSTGGIYTSPGDTSAYSNDWAVGAQFTNFAFAEAVPEPASWALLIAGFGLTGAAMRRRRNVAVAA